MPHLKPSLWSTVINYLPKAEKQVAIQAIKEVEESFEKRKILKAQQARPIDHLFYNNIISSKHLSFLYFKQSPKEQKKHTFKFHISISPQDYEMVLAKSSLNRFLQKSLFTFDKPTILNFKFVDSECLQKSIQQGKLIKPYLTNFYKMVEKYRGLDESQYEQKFNLYKSIYAWYKWLQTPLNNSLPELNELLETNAKQFYIYMQLEKPLAELNEIMTSNERLVNGAQYTLYISTAATKENLIEFIRCISDSLEQEGIRAAPCPASDLPLTKYVTYRQERFVINGEYIAVYDKRYAELKEFASNSSVYTELVQALAIKDEVTLSPEF